MQASLAEPQAASSAVRSAAEIRRWVVTEVALATNVDPSTVDPAAPLGWHGVDSLGAMVMTGALAAWLGQDVPATLMWDYATIDALAAGLAAEAAAAAPAPRPRGVIEFQREGAAAPIFCFPGIGGHPVTFAHFATHLGTDRPCLGLTVPGLEGEMVPLTSVEAIAAAMVENLRRVQPKGPYHLAGYSFGGLLAFEAARQLAAAGETVPFLAIFDVFTPAGRAVRPRWQRLGLHAYVLMTRRGRRKYLRDAMRGRREARRVDEHAAEGAATTGGSPTAHVRAVDAANRRASVTYQPGNYPGAAIFLPAADRPSYDLFYKIDASGGWAAVCGGGVRVIEVPGNHLTLLDAKRAKRVVDALRPHLP